LLHVVSHYEHESDDRRFDHGIVNHFLRTKVFRLNTVWYEFKHFLLVSRLSSAFEIGADEECWHHAEHSPLDVD